MTQNKQRRNLGFVLLPLVLAAGICLGIIAGKYFDTPQRRGANEKMRIVMGLIEDNYVDSIDVDSLMEASLPEILRSLDPHSVYLTKEDLSYAAGDIEGSFSGVGISFQIVADTVIVVDVISGGPAEKVGLEAGDRIISADSVALTGDTITNDKVFRTLRGEKGTPVSLKVKRTSMKTPIEYVVTRGDIPVNSIDSYYMLDDDIGYIKVNTFSRNTYMEFLRALTLLRSEGAKDYVVDLRDNGGGLMDQVIFMANEFLPSGRMIVYTQGRNSENNNNFISDGRGHFFDSKIAVLTNEYSASASEIFAGALQDNDRGVVIGRRSFGKGLVQNQIELPDSTAVRLTVARYYTPSGRSIQKDYKRGADGKYELDIADRYSHGEFYNVDSIKLDESKQFKTLGGRTVYGGGGIMPDIFVPQDTTGYTSYLVNVSGRGLIQKYAFDYTDANREQLKEIKNVEDLMEALPSDQRLLENFVAFAARNGVPARWYYINQSRPVLLRQLKAVIARDVLGYSAMNQILNRDDITVLKAIEELKNPTILESLKK